MELPFDFREKEFHLLDVDRRRTPSGMINRRVTMTCTRSIDRSFVRPILATRCDASRRIQYTRVGACDLCKVSIPRENPPWLSGKLSNPIEHDRR